MFIRIKGEGQRLINVLQINTFALAQHEDTGKFFVSFLMINGLEISSEFCDTLEEAEAEYDDIYDGIGLMLRARPPRERR